MSNYFKTTSLAVGDSITLVVTDVQENKYGTMDLVGTVNGEQKIITASGNLKFFAADVAKGTRQLNKAYLVTRSEDMNYKGYKTSQFKIAEAEEVQSAQNSVASKLAAIRAKRQ